MFILSACSNTRAGYYPYHSEFEFRGSYSETQIDKNAFRVSFHGNGATKADYAEDRALLRSAEVVL